MKLGLILALLAIVVISGCTQNNQVTTSSPTTEKTKYVCPDGSTVDNPSNCITTSPSTSSSQSPDLNNILILRASCERGKVPDSQDPTGDWSPTFKIPITVYNSNPYDVQVIYWVDGDFSTGGQLGGSPCYPSSQIKPCYLSSPITIPSKSSIDITATFNLKYSKPPIKLNSITLYPTSNLHQTDAGFTNPAIKYPLSC